MTITQSRIAAALRSEDIEGLFALGVPQDEYDAEARAIFYAIQALPDGHRNEAEIVAILALTWADAFDLTAADIQQRLSALQRVARKIVAVGT